MDAAVIETRLTTALGGLIGTLEEPGRGRYLVRLDANERSISHHLANCLAVQFTDWDVDVEYNRDGHDDNKLLQLPLRKEPSSDDVDARTVYPDIIVHHRGLHGSANNLLVVEVKKSSNREVREHAYDRLKLRQFQRELAYCHAYLVILKTDNAPMDPWCLERIDPDFGLQSRVGG
jgi:hypothetical protein